MKNQAIWGLYSDTPKAREAQEGDSAGHQVPNSRLLVKNKGFYSPDVQAWFLGHAVQDDPEIPRIWEVVDQLVERWATSVVETGWNWHSCPNFVVNILQQLWPDPCWRFWKASMSVSKFAPKSLRSFPAMHRSSPIVDAQATFIAKFKACGIPEHRQEPKVGLW